MAPDYSIENGLIGGGYSRIAGVDEVGRGVLCGSVVAAAVIIPTEMIPVLAGRVNDSKKLSPKKREELFGIITSTCEYGIGEVDNTIVDEINILEATKLAMKKAISKLSAVDFVIIDGNITLSDVTYKQSYVVKGDSKSISIAAASIVAKVYRDCSLCELDVLYPDYGFKQHKGYGTKQHLAAIEKFGLTPYHRRTFGGIVELAGGENAQS